MTNSPAAQTDPALLGFVVLLLVGSALLCWLIARLLSPVARRIGWTDKPNHRKHHDGEIPLVGGAAMVATLLVAGLVVPWAASALGLALAIALMLLVGGFDDLYPVRARYRFAAQIVAGIAIVFLGDTLVRQLGQCFYPGELGLSLLAVPFTLVAIAGLANAYNMTDGLDGLCGGHALIALVWFSVAALIGGGLHGQSFAEIMPVVVPAIGALLGFLALNARGYWRSRAAIFLGDGGSMTLGIVVAWVAISVTQPYDGRSLTPAAAVWIVAVPVADMFACMIRRVLEGKTPMTADRGHVHHMLLAAGMPAASAVNRLHLASIATGAVGVGAWALGVAEYLQFWALALVFAAYLVYSLRFWREHELGSRPAGGVAVPVSTATGGVAWQRENPAKAVD